MLPFERKPWPLNSMLFVETVVFRFDFRHKGFKSRLELSKNVLSLLKNPPMHSKCTMTYSHHFRRPTFCCEFSKTPSFQSYTTFLNATCIWKPLSIWITHDTSWRVVSFISPDPCRVSFCNGANFDIACHN